MVASTSVSVLADASATHSEPSPTVMPVGSEPTATVWTASSVAVSTRVRVPSKVLVTHTSEPSMANAPALAPTGIESTVAPVTGSIR